MGVNEGRGALARAVKDLLLRWQDARNVWNDVNAKRFEEERLIPLQQDLKAAVSAMDSMAVLIQQVRHDCE